MPTSLAICLFSSVEEIVRLIGHDGSQPGEGQEHQGFTPEDVIHPAWELGWIVSFMPLRTCAKDQALIAELLKTESKLILMGEDSVGMPHAIAYMDGVFYDTNSVAKNQHDLKIDLVGLLKRRHDVGNPPSKTAN